MMKTLLTLTVAVLAIGAVSSTVSPAFAKHHGGGKFDKMDKNGDGTITKSEFISVHEEKFERMDANNDGVVTKEEARAAKAGKKEKYRERRKGRRQEGGQRSPSLNN